MPGFAIASLVVACQSGGSSGSDQTTGGAPILGPDVIVSPVPSDPVVVPCDAVRIVRIENRGTDDHRVDAIAFTAEGPLALQPDLVLPRIVRAGGAFDVEVLVGGSTPGEGDAHVVVTSDEGIVSTDLHVDIGYGPTRSESFVTGLPHVDVLLVVDHSGNMAVEHEDAVERGIPEFLDALTAIADWQMILVTDDDGCNNGRVFSPADPDADWISDHAFDSSPGESELTEHLLELASRALAQNAPSECNAPFLRAGSQLHVIALSDEPEQSGQSGTYWVSDFETYANDVTVSAIVDEDQDCGAGGDGYLDAVEATDGMVLDICDGSWGSRMEQLADAVPVLPARFVLAEDAQPESIVVKAGGAPIGHTYDAQSRTVTLGKVVAVGTAVEITYGVPGVCEVVE